MTLGIERVERRKRVLLERVLQLMLYELGMWPGPDGLIDWGESLDDFFTNPRSLPVFFVMEGEQLRKDHATGKGVLSPGDSVTHAVWGTGTVKGIIGQGTDAIATAAFAEPTGTRRVSVADEVVGFALLHLDRTFREPDGRTDVGGRNLIDAYYVTPNWRGKGIGAAAAHLIFDRYPGRWVITCWPDDARVRFWRRVTARYQRGRTREFSPGQHKGFPGQHVWLVNSAHGESTSAGTR